MQRIPQSSFTKKEPVAIDIPILLKGERKFMQPVRMATNPASSDANSLCKSLLLCDNHILSISFLK